MTADYIAFHAAERPAAVAFLDNGRAVTYAELDRELRQFMHALSELGLRHGNSIAVGCDDLYVHYVILLAAQQLGVATTSLLRAQIYREALVAQVDRVLSEWEIPAALGKPRHEISPDWIKSVRQMPEIDHAALPRKSPEDIVRIAGTAGTTGEPKLVRSRRRVEDGRRDDCIWALGFTSRSRFVLTSTFDTGFIFPAACAVACVGGTVVLEGRRYLSQVLVSEGITHLLLFPIHLKTMLDNLPDNFAKPRDLSICTFGATLPETVRARAMARLATVLYDYYGSREAGFVSRIAASGTGSIGTVAPGVEVEVLDEAGNPLPFGQLGRLRMRAPFQQTEYVGNPAATARTFRDGWVLSEDVGVMPGPRRLQIMGRRDDMINIGGAKLPPSVIEDLVLRLVNIKDAGAFAQPGRDGIGEIWIAVVDAQLDDRELWTRIDAGLAVLRPAVFHVVRLPQIPRNPGGKIQRELLKQAVSGAREILRPV